MLNKDIICFTCDAEHQLAASFQHFSTRTHNLEVVVSSPFTVFTHTCLKTTNEDV